MAKQVLDSERTIDVERLYAIANELTLLSVYQSSKIDCFHANIRWQNDWNDVGFGSLSACQKSITRPADPRRKRQLKIEKGFYH